MLPAGVSGILLIAATYVYFLIFAQFGFLKRLDALGISGDHLKLVMGSMAAGGILSSLLAPRLLSRITPAARLRVGLGGCALAALLSALPLSVFAGAAVAALIGLALGLLTVTLVTYLPRLLASREPLLQVGLGTGLGYFLCNLPPLFRATPNAIALCSAAACLLVLPLVRTHETQASRSLPGKSPSFAVVLLWFTALIWLDSAAFFIIQSSPALRSGTWEGAAHLWRNGVLHLLGALASALLIARRGLFLTLLTAFGCLASACLLLISPEHAYFAAVLYPVGVSLYSVALVAAPSFLLSVTSTAERGRKAGWIYAVAGWTGSALGIGMGQNLHRVPPAFVAAAAVLFAIPLLLQATSARRIQATAVGGSLLLATGLHRALYRFPSQEPGSQIAEGRSVYIAEGCIHCHSQYIRPNSAADMLMWGPTRDLESIRREHPPLIGNRRQGPDLSQVGSRRSPLWLRMHFINPRDVSRSSIMPSYEYLFHDGRGEALIAYAASLKTADSLAHLQHLSSTWQPVPKAPAPDLAAGQRLFGKYCGTCHLPDGRARARWAASFHRLPPYLDAPNLANIPGSDVPSSVRTLRLAQIVKFGLPGADMPGHEYLPDSDVLAIANYVNSLRPGASPPAASALAEAGQAFTSAGLR